MASRTENDQFKFLISCIRYSNNGKIDFAEVATECSIVTKGAAAKRYERMMKAHGIQGSGSPGGRTISDAPKTPRKVAAPRAKSAKKRKVSKEDSDDEEEKSEWGSGIKSESDEGHQRQASEELEDSPTSSGATKSEEFEA